MVFPWNFSSVGRHSDLGRSREEVWERRAGEGGTGVSSGSVDDTGDVSREGHRTFVQKVVVGSTGEEVPRENRDVGLGPRRRSQGVWARRKKMSFLGYGET